VRSKKKKGKKFGVTPENREEGSKSSMGEKRENLPIGREKRRREAEEVDLRSQGQGGEGLKKKVEEGGKKTGYVQSSPLHPHRKGKGGGPFLTCTSTKNASRTGRGGGKREEKKKEGNL